MIVLEPEDTYLEYTCPMNIFSSKNITGSHGKVIDWSVGLGICGVLGRGREKSGQQWKNIYVTGKNTFNGFRA